MSVMAGVAVGGLAGLGATVTVYRLPRFRRPSLDDRLAPYLRDAPQPSRLLATDEVHTPFPTLERILRPVMKDAIRGLDRVLGGAASTRRRLIQSGSQMSVEEFRAEQVLWAAVGLVAGVGLSLAMLAGNAHRSPVFFLLLCGVTTMSGVVGRDFALSQEVRRRERRMIAELPAVAEMLALAVGAGEGAGGAIDRIARTSRGELAKELAVTLAEARAGTPLVRALENLADRTSLPALSRFVDGITVAIERGTPLADVLRAQATDVREAGKRDLMESGGKREIAMMVPVVFLILPVTILFALYPGFIALRLFT